MFGDFYKHLSPAKMLGTTIYKTTIQNVEDKTRSETKVFYQILYKD